MERENYLESLRNMTENMRLTNEKSASTSQMVRHGNLRTISTQTNDGIWLDTKKPKNKRKRQSTESIEDVKNIRGTVNVDGNNLISDDYGRYYMRVELNDVRPHRNNSNTHTNYRNCPPPHSSNIEQVSGRSYYANQRLPNHSSHRLNPTHSSNIEEVASSNSNTHTSYRNCPPPTYSNHRPNPNGTFLSNQSRHSNDRIDRRNTGDYNTRTFGQSFHQPKLYRDSDDLFK